MYPDEDDEEDFDCRRELIIFMTDALSSPAPPPFYMTVGELTKGRPFPIQHESQIASIAMLTAHYCSALVWC